MLKIELISNISAFAVLRDEWNGLLAESSLDNVFLTHEWLYTWWEVFGEGNELFIVCCRDDENGKLVGLFPGYRKATGNPLNVRTIRFLGSEYVTSDFLECIAQVGREKEVYGTLLDYLAENLSHWDVLEWSDITEESSFGRYLAEQKQVTGFSIQDNDKRCPYIPLPVDWEEFLMSLSSKMRRNVRYFRNQLERQHVVEVEEISSSDALLEAMPDMIRLHQDRKEDVGFSGRFVSENYKKFHSEICRRFLPLNRLSLVFLKVDGMRVAFYYNFRFKRRLHVYQSGFDTEWGKASVGTVLLGYLVERSIKRGDLFFDFLRGHERYKYHWTNTERKLFDYILYNDSVRGQIAGLSRTAVTSAKSGLKKVLPESLVGVARKVLGSGDGK